jgi:hypothetical protein
MKVFLMLIVSATGILYACRLDNPHPVIHERLGANGKVVERWGNYDERDQSEDFRMFLYYDSLDSLVKERYYGLKFANGEYNIADSLDFIETTYEYRNGELVFERKFFPVYDSRGKALRHQLSFFYNHETGETIVPQMSDSRDK